MCSSNSIGVTGKDMALRRVPIRVCLWSILLALAFVPSARAQTLRDEVREKGFVWQSLSTDSRTVGSLKTLVQGSDLVIKGRVVDERVRLSKDELSVLTDYTVEVLEIYRDSTKTLKPGGRVVVTKTGGNILVDGKPVRVETPDFPPLSWVEPYILLMSRSTDSRVSSQFYFTGNQLGVLELRDAKVVCKPPARARHPASRQFCGATESQSLDLIKSIPPVNGTQR